MAHTLVAMYHHPDDPEAFDRHYEATHSKLALALPGLRSYTGTRLAPGPDGTPPPYYFIAVLSFDDQASLAAAVSSPEGQAAVGDLANFASTGVALVDGPTTTYR